MGKMFKGLALLFIFCLGASLTAAWAEEGVDRSTPHEKGVFTLGEVVVTAKKETSNLATTVSEVTEEDIKAQGAQTAAEAIEMVPGVHVSIGGKGQASLRIRGFSKKNIKILIDGVPANETYYGTVDLSQIPVDSIAKITVAKGATSALYGPNTMGGVINIITKKGGKKPVTEFTTSFGDYDTRNYVLNHGATLGKFNYWLTYSYRESDGFRLSSHFNENSRWVGRNSEYHEDGGKRDLSGYIKRGLNAKVGYEPDSDTKIYLSFDYHNNAHGCPTESDRYWRMSRWKQWHLNLVGKKKINNMLTIKAQGFYLKHDEEVDDVSWDGHQTKRKWFEWSRYHDYSTGGMVQAYLHFGKWDLLKAGFNYIRDNHKQKEYLDKDCFSVKRGWDQPGIKPEEEYEADTYTFALEDEIYPTDRLSFVFGMDYDYFNPRKAYDQPVPNDIDTLNPQGGVVFDLTEDTTLHASIGKKTRFPHLKELYSKHAGGNPNLKPQKNIAYEVGVEKRFGQSVKASVSWFYNDISDLIQRVRVGHDRIYKNIGKARTEGVEADIQMKVSDNLWIGTNYTYLSTRDYEKDRELEGRPRHRLNIDARYRLPFNIYATMQASYTHRQFEYLSAGRGRPEIVRRLPDFFLLNARISKHFGRLWGVGSEVFAEVTNLTDTNYDEGHGPMPGRSFLVGLTLRY